MSYLFQCAIGPVQEFIATARRSRDLWYGSWLLSELSKAAAKAIADGGGQLIFPSTTAIGRDLTAKSLFNAPNKIVGVIDGPPDHVAKSVDTAIRGRLRELRDNAFSAPRGHALFDRALAEAQVDDLVEFYWVSVQFDGVGGYAQARQKAEASLNARKATRDFAAVKGDFRPKSSLDGARESVIAEKAYAASNDHDSDKAKKAKTLFERFGARPAERLSGVDILKRLGERGSSAATFPSTSHMAALPFLKHVDDTMKEGNSSQLLSALKELLEDENVPSDETDGSLVYSSRLTEWVPQKEKRDRIGQKVEELLRGYAGGVRPRPYYALLAADGDNMGAAIDFLTTQPHPVEGHRKLSVALSGFADKVADIVEDHEGVLVYSGGDDVLAYLPLHTVLQCADQVAEEFAGCMSGFKTDRDVSPTLSTGIVIVHHLEPLTDALELVRDAERAAKTVNGKHGLAITVSKRSGVDRRVVGKRNVLHRRLQQMIDWRRNGAISVGAAYELQALDRVLGKSSVPNEAIIAEALRIIERKRETGGEKDVDDAVKRALRQWVQVDGVKLQELTFELIVAGLFADALDLAGGKLRENTP